MKNRAKLQKRENTLSKTPGQNEKKRGKHEKSEKRKKHSRKNGNAW